MQQETAFLKALDGMRCALISDGQILLVSPEMGSLNFAKKLSARNGLCPLSMQRKRGKLLNLVLIDIQQDDILKGFIEILDG